MCEFFFFNGVCGWRRATVLQNISLRFEGMGVRSQGLREAGPESRNCDCLDSPPVRQSQAQALWGDSWRTLL